MMNWLTQAPEDDPVTRFLRAILTMNVDLAAENLSKIDPNASDFHFPSSWRLMRQECRGSRLLHEAVTYSCANNGNENRLEIVDMLLKAGADPNHLTVSGYSALHNAATVNHAPACRLLILHGAHINQQSIKGYTPLLTASVYKGTDATAALLMAGADFTLTNIQGENAYQYALRRHHDGAIRLLDVVRLREEADAILLEIGAEQNKKAIEREQSQAEGGLRLPAGHDRHHGHDAPEEQEPDLGADHGAAAFSLLKIEAKQKSRGLFRSM